MQFKELLADDDAVSPVIGVILMVAITVILAAVIGTFVLGIGQDQQTTPSASFDFEVSSGPSLTVTHTGGDSFTSENTNQLEVTGSSTGSINTITSFSSGGIGAGDTVASGASVSAGETIRVIWTAPGGGKTQTVGSFDVPN